MTNNMQLAPDLNCSRLVLGFWRLLDWEMSPQDLLTYIKQSMNAGVTTFDHADIYGNHECEAAFGKALALEPSLREKMQLVTKCGIKLKTDKFPDRNIKYYDYSAAYIISQAEQSLKQLRTDRVELLLLHRPSPFFNPEEVARAFDQLKQAGKVLHLGVSNFLPRQMESLQAFLDEPLVTNQLEISPYCLEHFDNHNLDYLLSKKTPAMAWSPLAGGKLLQPLTPKAQRVHAALQKVADELGVTALDKIIFQWLLKHPAQILPVLGTGKIARVQSAVSALDLSMSLEQWFEIYTASTGVEVP